MAVEPLAACKPATAARGRLRGQPPSPKRLGTRGAARNGGRALCVLSRIPTSAWNRRIVGPSSALQLAAPQRLRAARRASARRRSGRRIRQRPETRVVRALRGDARPRSARRRTGGDGGLRAPRPAVERRRRLRVQRAAFLAVRHPPGSRAARAERRLAKAVWPRKHQFRLGVFAIGPGDWPQYRTPRPPRRARERRATRARDPVGFARTRRRGGGERARRGHRATASRASTAARRPSLSRASGFRRAPSSRSDAQSRSSSRARAFAVWDHDPARATRSSPARAPRAGVAAPAARRTTRGSSTRPRANRGAAPARAPLARAPRATAASPRRARPARAPAQLEPVRMTPGARRLGTARAGPRRRSVGTARARRSPRTASDERPRRSNANAGRASAPRRAK